MMICKLLALDDQGLPAWSLHSTGDQDHRQPYADPDRTLLSRDHDNLREASISECVAEIVKLL